MDAQANVQLERARAAAVAKLAGRSPREVGAEKNALALRWVYNWGWSSASLIDALVTPGRRGVAARLVKTGLLERHACPSAGGVRGVPTHVLTLTPAAVAQVESKIADEKNLLEYPDDGLKLIAWRQLTHDIGVQYATLKRILNGKIKGYLTPRQIAAQSTPEVKQPDAVWVDNADRKVAIELELTSKKGREFDQTVRAIMLSLDPQKGRYNSCLIFSTSEAILRKYKNAFRPGAEFKKWTKNDRRFWSESGIFTMPDWIVNKVHLKKADEWL